MKLKQVVIVGKPNVGKSQLFNRLTGERHSIVYSEPGVTRDRVSLEVKWLNHKFLLTDTGGYTLDLYSFRDEINRQTDIALREADLILFVISAKEGIDNDDLYLSKILKKRKASNILLVANKCENENMSPNAYDYYKLGFGEPIFVSAEHGINTGPLLSSIISSLDLENPDSEEEEEKLKLAIIGKPNVGKSSLVNSLLQEERVIISDVSGTTRDAVDLNFEYMGNKYVLIDTPGIRRHAQIYKNEQEKYSVLRSKKAISRSNLILLVLDISEDLSELDERIGGLIYKSNIPTIIVGNKWDLITPKNEKARMALELNIRTKFPFLKWSPIVFISAKLGDKLSSIFKYVDLIKQEQHKVVSQANLNLFMHKVSSLFPVPTVKGNKLKIFSISQIKSQNPTFLIICNNPDWLHFSYSRLIENQFRSAFGYKITPIMMIYKQKKN